MQPARICTAAAGKVALRCHDNSHLLHMGPRESIEQRAICLQSTLIFDVELLGKR